MSNQIGVLLPSAVPGTSGETILTWARLIDEGPFSSLGAADRYVYVNHELMMTMAAAAAVTSRVRLTTAALLPPLRPTPLVGKQVATLVSFAPGRVTLGVAVGNRVNDYESSGREWSRRGKILDEQIEYLAAMRDLKGEENCVGPECAAFELLIGGASDPAIRRLLAHGDGLVSGGVKPEVFAFEAYAAMTAWEAAGKPGRPRLVASTWFSSSERAGDLAEARLASYLAKGGPPEPVLSGISRGREGVEAAVRAYRAQGADEVTFFPLVDDVSELEWLAEVVRDLPDIERGEPAPDFSMFGGAEPSVKGRHA
ncbi:LLM class flavin-dependent oxidoreductase [Nonomuraea soli]|uniref:Alkanesulfonate monooxygenase SsuD/methylene tetrahydromethanopterin reductase-like flavin-dependent oxidoreductase (Luciferase family) n=1 Tax=Nonomuraea soli TaxID=1032476 RepID=A0A7W0HNT0_9ACTN|nr:LLM class flavin-dependent oxidoreductase [Nonomuraea soli]MBA2890125.1 alkanesulfonate monooxygenase SsuD/methylene tetrahydromethanopterin reductase-like flavin-dependent oxidoreductase (luciferase family) [Nonomuraea soli]